MVEDAEHALGSACGNRMVQRGEQVFQDDGHAVDDARGERGGVPAGYRGLHDEQHQRGDAQQHAYAVAHGVEDLFTQGVAGNGVGGPRLLEGTLRGALGGLGRRSRSGALGSCKRLVGGTALAGRVDQGARIPQDVIRGARQDRRACVLRLDDVRPRVLQYG